MVSHDLQEVLLNIKIKVFLGCIIDQSLVDLEYNQELIFSCLSLILGADVRILDLIDQEVEELLVRSEFISNVVAISEDAVIVQNKVVQELK